MGFIILFFSILVVCLISNPWFRNLRYGETVRAVRELEKYRDSLPVITISYGCAQWNYAISLLRRCGRRGECFARRVETSRVAAGVSRQIHDLEDEIGFSLLTHVHVESLSQLAAAYAAAHSVASSSA